MTKMKTKGWSVALSGLGINLALGILYTWSMFKIYIEDSIRVGDGRFNWDMSSLNDPYAVCCLVFSFSMVLGGRIQDKIGPRLTAMIGGVLAGSGLVWISQSYDVFIWILGFGVLAGLGLGFAYAAALPPAIKWFPPSKTGFVAGFVVSGFGLASVYIAPLTKYLISVFDLSVAMLFLGIGFFIIVCGLSQFLINPPVEYHTNISSQSSELMGNKVKNFLPKEMLKDVRFYLLWVTYFVGAGAGLMIIGNIAEIAKKSLGEIAWIVVAIMAVGNASGRLIAGILSDKIGRILTLQLMLVFQGLIMFFLMFVGKENALIMVLLATFIGFNYGTNLTLFPSVTKDFFGLKNFGINYGLLFTAWGVGGFVLPRLSQMIRMSTNSFYWSYFVAGSLLFVGFVLTKFVSNKNKDVF